MAANVLFTANNFLMKAFYVNVSDAVLVRCIVQIFILTTYIYVKGDSLIPEGKHERVLTILQGILLSVKYNFKSNNYFEGISGAVNLILSLASVKTIAVVEALSIIYFSPIITTFLGVLMLGKICSNCKNILTIFRGKVQSAKDSLLPHYCNWRASGVSATFYLPLCLSYLSSKSSSSVWSYFGPHSLFLC